MRPRLEIDRAHARILMNIMEADSTWADHPTAQFFLRPDGRWLELVVLEGETLWRWNDARGYWIETSA